MSENSEFARRLLKSHGKPNSNNGGNTDPFKNYHMSKCIVEKVEEMNDPQKCQAYLAGRMYEASKTRPEMLTTSMGTIKETCRSINDGLPLAFYVDLCTEINEAYADAGDIPTYKAVFDQKLK